MFAAAAVAAAAAFTAITATQTQQIQEIERPKPRISWTQYANQRRNSLQRRKIEISKRLEKASTANKRTYQITSNFTASPATIGPTTSYATTTTDPTQKATSHAKSANYNHNSVHPNTLPIMQSHHASDKYAGHGRQHLFNFFINEDNNIWIKDLTTNVCNEFIKIHRINEYDSKRNQFHHSYQQQHNSSNYPRPTYDHFEILESLKKLSLLAVSQNEYYDINEIGDALYEFLQSQNAIILNDEGGFHLNNLPPPPSHMKKNPQVMRQGTEPGRNSKQGQQALNIQGFRRQETMINQYTCRWDPKWLRYTRNLYCIPIALITLIFLIYTNASSNWIKLDVNQRAGLWNICNKTLVPIINEEYFSKEPFNEHNESSSDALNKSGLFTITSSPNSVRLLKLLEDASFVGKSGSSRTRTAPTTQIIAFTNATQEDESTQPTLTTYDRSKFNEIETCTARFLFKEDGHLAVLSLSIVSILFHFLGLILLLIGLVSAPSSRVLYFHHSAGECLLTSGIVNGLQLLAFITLASSQLGQPFRYGLCFYVNIVVSLITFFSSLFFYLDDMVNEYRLWKIRINAQDKRDSQLFLTS